VRVPEALFPPQFVTAPAIAAATVRPCWTRVIVDAVAPQKAKMLFYVDQIRDLDRFNQLLARQNNGSVAEAAAQAEIDKKKKKPAAESPTTTESKQAA